MKPPIRLRDDPATPAELRNDLERSAAALPDFDVAAGLVGLHAAIVNLSLPASLPATAEQTASAPSLTDPSLAASATATKAGSAALAGFGGTKLVLVAGLVLGAMAALAVIPKSSSRQARESQQAASRPSRPDEHTVKTALQPAPLPPVITPEVPAPSADSATPLSAPLSAPTVVRQPALGADAQASLRREIEQVGRIKLWVESDPARAYELAQAGQHEFPRGMLRQEREALLVLALWNMGSHTQARREASAFLQRYAESPLRARLERLLEEDP
jgi:hypothetical protein